MRIRRRKYERSERRLCDRPAIPVEIQGRLATMLLLIATLSAIGCGSRETEPVQQAAPSQPRPRQVIGDSPRAEFVGMDRCVECHAERVQEFRQTRHALACVESAQATMPVGFLPGRNRYETHHSDLNFEMTRTGGEYLMSAVRQTPHGEERSTSRVDFVYGHGAGTDEAYFRWQDGRVFELPMVWLHPQECWGSTPINPFSGGDYSRPLTAQCLNCHNTWIDCRPGVIETFDQATALLGVTCERCHGPAREHVTFHEQHPQERTARAIVHPGKLSRERLIDLCAQCHDNAIKFRRPPFSYRPGDVLSDFVRTPEFQFPEDNHVANQNRGMQVSRCFQASDAMTCITCHDPHRSRSQSNAGAASCARCHTPSDCGEHERLPPPIRGDCIGCHMPKFNKVQVNFRTEQDAYVAPVPRWEHRIAVYPAARDAVRLQYLKSLTDPSSRIEADKLSASLAEYWRRRADEFRGESRFLMAIDACRESQRFESTTATEAQIQDLVQIQTQLDEDWFRASQQINEGQSAAAIQTLEGILSRNPRMARAHGRLGTLYAAAGRQAEGVRHLLTSIELDPNDSYGHGMLGWLAYLDGRFEEAVQHFRRANHLEPRNAKLQFQLGLSLMGGGRLREAEETLVAVLDVQPDHVDTYVALAHACQSQERFSEALAWAEHARELTGESNSQVLMLLSDCYLKTGKLEVSRRLAEQVLEAASADPALERRARSRLNAIRLHLRRIGE